MLTAPPTVLSSSGTTTLTAGFGESDATLGDRAGKTITLHPGRGRCGERRHGGGWISNSIGRTAFGFNAIQDVTGLHGQLQVRTKKDRFYGSAVSALTSSGNTATWSGTGRWNGTPGYRFTVTAVESGSDPVRAVNGPSANSGRTAARRPRAVN